VRVICRGGRNKDGVVATTPNRDGSHGQKEAGSKRSEHASAHPRVLLAFREASSSISALSMPCDHTTISIMIFLATATATASSKSRLEHLLFDNSRALSLNVFSDLHG
jgi:hypothetical protein